MKTLTTLIGLFLAASLVSAADPDSTGANSGATANDPYGSSAKAPASDRSDSSASQASRQAKLTAEVVAADETSKTITVKQASSSSASSTTAGAESVTLPVEGKAVASLKSIKSGEPSLRT